MPTMSSISLYVAPCTPLGIGGWSDGGNPTHVRPFNLRSSK